MTLRRSVYISIIQEQLSEHFVAASTADMSASLIASLSLILTVTARNFRSDYNYEYYDNHDSQNTWQDNDYHYEKNTEGIGQAYNVKF